MSNEDERPITSVRYVVVDTELTGLDEKRDSIISIGAVRMTGSRIDLKDTFYKLVNPDAELKPKSVVIHGITPSEIKEKPLIDTVLSEFLDFCGSDVVVGHCLSIDLSFINKEMQRVIGSMLRNPGLDTFALFEWIKKRTTRHACFLHSPKGSGLYSLAKCFDIPINGAHNAGVDAFITAQLFQRCIPVLLELGIKSIGELLEIGDPLKGGDRYRTAGEVGNL